MKLLARDVQALAERNERRRYVIGILVGRLGEGSSGAALAPGDAVDLLFTLTSFPVYRSLAANRLQHAVCDLLKAACAAILDACMKP